MVDEPDEKNRKKPGVFKEQFFAWVNLLPQTWERVCQEAKEVREHPWFFFGAICLSLIVGCKLAGHFKENEIKSSKDTVDRLAEDYRRQGNTVEHYRLLVEDLRSDVEGLLPDEVAKQISSNIPPDQRIDIAIDLLSNSLERTELLEWRVTELDPTNEPITEVEAIANFLVVAATESQQQQIRLLKEKMLAASRDSSVGFCPCLEFYRSNSSRREIALTLTCSGGFAYFRPSAPFPRTNRIQINFVQQPLYPFSNLPKDAPVSTIDKLDLIRILAFSYEPEADSNPPLVLGGELQLTINNTIRRREIPRQQVSKHSAENPMPATNISGVLIY